MVCFSRRFVLINYFYAFAIVIIFLVNSFRYISCFYIVTLVYATFSLSTDGYSHSIFTFRYSLFYATPDCVY